MGKKLTHEEFIKRVLEKCPQIEICQNYINAHTKIKVKCKKCNREYLCFPCNLLKGYGCQKCSMKELANQKALKAKEDFYAKFEAKNKNAQFIKILGDYINNHTYVKCQCKRCGHEWDITPHNLLKGKGCPVCSCNKVKKGINDIGTLHPELVDYFLTKEEAYKYSVGSNKNIVLKCPFCGFRQNMRVTHLVKRGFNCKICSDKTESYPNRFAHAFFNLLPVDNYQIEYSPNWIAPKRYDNYFEYQNRAYIIEMDGGFHYQSAFNKTLAEIQMIDNYKDEQAIKHNIEVIRIDCRESSPLYIKKQILDSRLSSIFDLSNFDWEKCINSIHLASYVPIWNFVNEHLDMTYKEIGEVFDKSVEQIRRIVNIGRECSMCSRKTRHQSGISRSNHSITIIENGVIIQSFSSALKVRRYINDIYNFDIGENTILRACRSGKIHHGLTFQIQTNERSVT